MSVRPSYCPRVLFDVHHGADAFRLSETLKDEGYQLTRSYIPLNWDTLKSYDVLYINYRIGHKPYSAQEMEGVIRFVRDGGGLLLASKAWVWTKYDEQPIEEYPLNSIADRFGVFFDDGYAGQPTEIFPHPITGMVKNLSDPGGVPGPVSISFTQEAEEIVKDSAGKTLIAAMNHGQGRIVFLGDKDFLSDSNLDRDDNSRLAKNAFKWLSEHKAAVKHGCGEGAVPHSLSDTKTEWILLPSFKYDLLCFMGVLSGDPFLVRFHETAYQAFEKRIGQEVVAKINHCIQVFQEVDSRFSPSLCLILSCFPGESFDATFEALGSVERLEELYKKSRFYRESKWDAYLSVRSEIEDVCLQMQKAGFESYWMEDCFPDIEGRIEIGKAEVVAYDVIGGIEEMLGLEFNRRIEVYFCKFAAPYGIRISGNRYITDISWNTQIAVATAIHEMLHGIEYSGELEGYIESIERDPFVAKAFAEQKPHLRYSRFRGFVEENIVEAAHIYVSEKLGLVRDPLRYFKEHDCGSHVLGAVIYSHLRDNLPSYTGTLTDFLLHLFKVGRLGIGEIEKRYDSLYDADTCEQN